MKQKDMKEYFSNLGKKGGKKRWEGSTKEERSAYMTEMIKRRWQKKLSTDVT